MTEVVETTGEKAERKRMDSIWWAGALIWVGLVLGAEYLNFLPRLGFGREWWLWIFLGLGPWALVLNGYRAMSDLPNPSTWDWIWTAIFLLVGLGSFFNFAGEIVGAVALVAIGVVFLTRALRRSE
ncbi:MAG: hypothetical protein WBB65_10805 [Anaerolineales bacterium]